MCRSEKTVGKTNTVTGCFQLFDLAATIILATANGNGIHQTSPSSDK
jgi:hypothetical protein